MPEMEALVAFVGSVGFAWPLVFALFPLPWLLAFWQRRHWSMSADDGAIRLPFLDALPVLARAPKSAAGWHFKADYWLVFALLLVAGARPQWIDLADQRPASGRDVLLLLDVSASMQLRDLKGDGGVMSRLTAATRFSRSFLERRPGDRAGLIVFASRPYLYVPLTYDLAAVGAAIDSAALGLAGEQTALGDALGLAIKTLGDGAEGTKDGAVAVLISDGANTAGVLSPQQAAWLAAQQRVRVHTLGVGAAPDETGLRAMAEQTGGSYALATDLAGVRDFYARLDALEPVWRTGDNKLGAARELYIVPLVLALLAVVVRWAIPLLPPVLRRLVRPWRASGAEGGDRKGRVFR